MDFYDLPLEQARASLVVQALPPFIVGGLYARVLANTDVFGACPLQQMSSAYEEAQMWSKGIGRGCLSHERAQAGS